jgi:hypothetical protein
MVVLVSLRQKYFRLFSQIMPAGAVGVSLLLGGSGAAGAVQPPLALQPAASNPASVAERLAAIRLAVSDAGRSAVQQPGGEPQLAWGNWWRNGGWRNGGWGNWRNGWHNGWHNWWHNW